MNIAIDGPSGAGKSTIAKLLAKDLGIVYLDTGAMYRAISLKTFRMGFASNDEQNIKNLLEQTKIDIVYCGGTQIIFLDGKDVSEAIRQHHISAYASEVSKIREVRLKMAELQRRIAAGKDIVLDGRDIGTFVLPKAEYKFFLTATVAERAKRRYEELKEKGSSCTFDEIQKDIALRDYNDCSREFAPLKKADDAIEIDSTDLTIDEVVQKMLSYIKK